MKPTVILAETTASNGVQLALIAHDDHFFLQADGVQLESSFATGAASELGRLPCQPLRSARQPRILIAGLGLGFTLAAVREVIIAKRAVFRIAEPLSELPSWHRQFLSELHPDQLDDPRLEFRSHGLSTALKKPGDGFHAILLDLEGSLAPEGVADKQGVPHSSFLNRAHSALMEGGLLAICTNAPSSVIQKRFRQIGFDLSFEAVPAAHKGKQKRHNVIWLARKGSYSQKPRPSRPQSRS